MGTYRSRGSRVENVLLTFGSQMLCSTYNTTCNTSISAGGIIFENSNYLSGREFFPDEIQRWREREWGRCANNASWWPDYSLYAHDYSSCSRLAGKWRSGHSINWLNTWLIALLLTIQYVIKNYSFALNSFRSRDSSERETFRQRRRFRLEKRLEMSIWIAVMLMWQCFLLAACSWGLILRIHFPVSDSIVDFRPVKGWRYINIHRLVLRKLRLLRNFGAIVTTFDESISKRIGPV